MSKFVERPPQVALWLRGPLLPHVASSRHVISICGGKDGLKLFKSCEVELAVQVSSKEVRLGNCRSLSYYSHPGDLFIHRNLTPEMTSASSLTQLTPYGVSRTHNSICLYKFSLSVAGDYANTIPVPGLQFSPN